MASGGRDDPRGISGILETGTAVPNRIFVGGITANTNEGDLRNLFSKFGNVKATKILLDKAGISRGYGFVTFDTEEEAQKVLEEVKCVTLHGRSLNIAPAVKKQPYSRALESNSVHNASIVWPTQPYSGTSGFSRESIYYPQGSWPLMWPQHLYLQQQCPYPQTAQAGYPQYVYSVAPVDYQYPSAGAVAGLDYSETSSADSGESGKKNRSKAATSTPVSSDYDRGRSTQTKSSSAPSSGSQRYNSGNGESPSSFVHSPSMHPLHHPVFAKTANGIAVMAYPSFVMGSPTLVHVRDGNGESDNVMTELGFLHSPIASGALTPPPTPLASIQCDFNANASIDPIRKN